MSPWGWFVDHVKKHKKEALRRKYIDNLEYAIHRLGHPKHDDIDPPDRKYRIEAAVWLREYYAGNPDFVADGPPESKLRKLLSKPTRDVTLRDHVYVKVFYYWKEHHRVEGF